VPPTNIVINEWLPHDIKGDNGLLAQQRAGFFLEAIRGGNNRIIVLRESKWEAKVWQLWKENDTRIQLLSKLLFLSILIDPLKCRHLRPDEVQPLPANLAGQVPPDDTYLFQAALAEGAKTIITTDGRLIKAVTSANDYGIQLVPRDNYYQLLGIQSVTPNT
jgi:hypothetical protein